MTARTSMLRPGYLVALHTTIKGGIRYERTDLPAEKMEDGTDVARWETKRTIADAEEWERATKERSKAGSLVRQVCSATSFGLMCPLSKEEDLDKAIAEARARVAAFNATAANSEINIYILKGRIADNDQDAVKAIAGEVRGLLDEMNAAIDKLDPGAIRDAANRARQLGAVLSPEQNAKVADAVKAARQAANALVKRVEKGGEQAAIVLADMDRSAISVARMSFLDIEAPAPLPAALPATTLQRFDALDVGDEQPQRQAAQAQPLPVIEDESDAAPVALPAIPVQLTLFDLIDEGSDEPEEPSEAAPVQRAAANPFPWINV